MMLQRKLLKEQGDNKEEQKFVGEDDYENIHGLSVQAAAGIGVDFQEFVTEAHSTSTLLDGALRISCTDKEVQMKARLCPFEKFGLIAECLQDDKLVSLCKIM